MRKRIIFPVVFVVMLAWMLAWVPPASAEIPEVKIKWANFMHESSDWSKADNFFAAEMLKRSNGKVQIKVFHGSTMGAVTEMAKLVGGGAVDVGNFPASYFFAQFPYSSGIAIPMQVFGIDAGREYAKRTLVHPLIKAENDRNNLHAFLATGLLDYHLIGHKPLKTIADLKGVKTRSFGSMWPVAFKAIGISPINVAATEVYESLQRSIIDAGFYDYAGMRTARVNEIAKNLSDINFGSMGRYLTYVNLKLWNSWPKELQDLWEKVALDTEIHFQKLNLDLEKQALAEFAAKGMKPVHFEDQAKMVAMLPDMVDEWERQVVKQTGNTGDASTLKAHIQKVVKDVNAGK